MIFVLIFSSLRSCSQSNFRLRRRQKIVSATELLGEERLLFIEHLDAWAHALPFKYVLCPFLIQLFLDVFDGL